MLGLWAWRADSSHLQPWALPRASSYTHRAQYVANCTTLYLNLYSTYTPVPSTSVYSYVNTSSITQINLAWIQLCCYLNLCNNFPPSSAANQAIPNKMARLVCSYGGSGFEDSHGPTADTTLPWIFVWIYISRCLEDLVWPVTFDGSSLENTFSTPWRPYRGGLVWLTIGHKLPKC